MNQDFEDGLTLAEKAKREKLLAYDKDTEYASIYAFFGPPFRVVSTSTSTWYCIYCALPRLDD